MNVIVLKIINSPEFNSLVHALKVAVFIVLSAGLSELLNQIGSLKLTPVEQMILSAVINALLAWLNKERELRNINVI